MMMALLFFSFLFFFNDPATTVIYTLSLPYALPLYPAVQKRITVMGLSSKRDEALCAVIEDLWIRKGCWPIQGVEPMRQTVEVSGLTLHVHGYAAELDAWNVLGFDPSEDQHLRSPDAKLPVGGEGVIKRTVCQAMRRKPGKWLVK